VARQNFVHVGPFFARKLAVSVGYIEQQSAGRQVNRVNHPPASRGPLGLGAGGRLEHGFNG
jgi:hypothetical protein